MEESIYFITCLSPSVILSLLFMVPTDEEDELPEEFPFIMSKSILARVAFFCIFRVSLRSFLAFFFSFLRSSSSVSESEEESESSDELSFFRFRFRWPQLPPRPKMPLIRFQMLLDFFCPDIMMPIPMPFMKSPPPPPAPFPPPPFPPPL